jgi:hypothetical protein
MNFRHNLLIAALFCLALTKANSQDYEADTQDYQIKTLFNTGPQRASGGYGALGNKFTYIRGEYANMAEIYGGWYINHKFLLGIAGAATTNDLRVPEEFSTQPGERMSYQYGQFGLMTEYTLWSNRAVHLSFHVMNGAGFTVQYKRYDWEDHEYWEDDNYEKDSNWFFVTEPGVKLEMNLFRWMRFAPGVSYRATFGSEGLGMSDSSLSDISYNVTLKFGKF